MASKSITLFGGSKRSIERRLFGDNIRIEINGKADRVTQHLTTAYAKAWRDMASIAGEMARIAARAKYENRTLSPREIARMDRVDRAQFALERQIRDLSKLTGVQVRGAATNGLGRFTANILDQIPSLAGVDRRFTKPSGAAMEGLILRATERITSATNALTASQEVALKNGLFRGLVLGENPTETARHILEETKGAFFGGLPRAKTIANTEIADAHRYATRLAYADSDLVVGWKWESALDARTCPACWAQHNTFHEKTELQFSHQNCRCSMVPVLVDDLPTDTDLGNPEEIFWNLPRDEQLKIMGPGRLTALEGGAPFSALSVLKNNPGWRPAYYPTTVKDLTDLAELSISTHPSDLIRVPGQSDISILDQAFRNGGLTIQRGTGEIPTSGIAVAQQAGAGIYDAREFFGPGGPKLVSDWMVQNGDALDSPTAHMGVWYNHADGKVYLDVVDVVKDRDAAIALGKSRNQIAVFDLGSFEEIPTGGTGLGPQEEATTLRDPDVGRGIRVIVDDPRQGPIQIDARVIAHDPTTGSYTVKGDDGYIRDVRPGMVVEFLTPPNTQSRVERVHDITKRAIDDTGLNFSYLNADPRVAQDASDAIRNLTSYFPDVKPNGVSTGEIGTNYAQTRTGNNPRPDGSSSEIILNSTLSADPQRWAAQAKQDEESGFHPPGSAERSVDFTVSHEYGHVLDNALFGQGERTKLLADVFSALGQKSSGPLTPAERDARTKAVRDDLSTYGSNYGLGETIAEAVGAYLLNGPGKSIVADTVMRGIVRRYEQRFGHRPAIPGLDKLMEGK